MLWYRLLQLKSLPPEKLEDVVKIILKSRNESAASKAIAVLITRFVARLTSPKRPQRGTVEQQALNNETDAILHSLNRLSTEWHRAPVAVSMVSILLPQLERSERQYDEKEYVVIYLLGLLDDERAIGPLLHLKADFATRRSLAALGPLRVVRQILAMIEPTGEIPVSLLLHLCHMIEEMSASDRTGLPVQVVSVLVRGALRREPRHLRHLLDALSLAEPNWPMSEAGSSVASAMLGMELSGLERGGLDLEALLERPSALVAMAHHDFRATESVLEGAFPKGGGYKDFSQGTNGKYWAALRTLWAAGFLTHLARVVGAFRSEDGKRYELIPTGRKYEYTSNGSTAFVIWVRDNLFSSILRHVASLSETDLHLLAQLGDVEVSKEGTDCLSRWWDHERIECAPLRQAARQELIRRGLPA